MNRQPSVLIIMTHIGKCLRTFFAGYYCPSEEGNPSTSSMENICGNVNRYCPNKSSTPLTVDIGYYSIGGGDDERHRTRQEICPKGSYCQQGRKFHCPAGSYGNQIGLLNQRCSGFCPAGYFCVDGSIEPNICPRNTYATSGNKLCTLCNNDLEDGYERCRTSRLCCSQ